MSKLEKLAEEIGGKATYHYIENYVHKAVVSPANWIPEGAEAIKALFHEIVKDVAVNRWGKITSGNDFEAELRERINDL